MSRTKQKRKPSRSAFVERFEIDSSSKMSTGEMIFVFFIVLLVLSGLGFIFFEKQFKEQFPDLDIDDLPKEQPDTSTPKPTESPQQPAQPSFLEPVFSNAATWIAIVLGIVLLLAVVIAGALRLHTKQVAEDKEEGIMSKTLKVNALRDVSKTLFEVIVSLAVPSGLFIIAAVMHKLKWSKARDWLLVLGYVFFIFFVVRETLNRGVKKSRSRLIVGVPSGILISLGLYFQYMGQKDFSQIFYLMGAGTFMLSIGYMNFLQWRKGAWDSFTDAISPTKNAERVTEAVRQKGADVKEWALEFDTVKNVVDWYYQEPEDSDEKNEAGIMTKISEYMFGATEEQKEEVAEAVKETIENKPEEMSTQSYLVNFKNWVSEKVYGEPKDQPETQEQEEQGSSSRRTK